MTHSDTKQNYGSRRNEMGELRNVDFRYSDWNWNPSGEGGKIRCRSSDLGRREVAPPPTKTTDEHSSSEEMHYDRDSAYQYFGIENKST
jgi:hypothetical protein